MKTSADIVLSEELSWRIESAHVEFTIERLEGISNQPGNPHDVRVTRFGRCAALTAALPIPWMNTIHLIGEAELGALRESVTAYRDAGRRPRVEVLPGSLTPQVGAALAALGLAQQGFHAAVYARTRAPDGPGPDGIEVRAVSADHFEVFLDTFLAGFQSSSAAKANMRHWLDRGNWRLYLATVDGTPAAAGILSVHGTSGYLAAAATAPAFRGAGCQSALIARRIADAHNMGCDLIVGQCEYASVSHRNMHRAGLQLAYTKAIWLDR